MKKFFLSIVIIVGSVFAEPDASLLSLVLPPGISYKFSPIRLTQDVSVSGVYDSSVVVGEDVRSEGCSSKESKAYKEKKSRNHETNDSGTSASASASIGLLSGINVGAGVEAHNKRGWHSEKSENNDYAETVNTSNVNIRSSRDGFLVKDKTKGAYGNHYLIFTLTLKNNEPDKIYQVEGWEGNPPRVIIEGLSQEILVPYTERTSFSIDVDERVCKFVYEVVDKVLLAELLSLRGKGELSKLKPKLTGGEFPIIERTSKRNILNIMRRAEKMNPSTEISIGVGDAKILSPWRVKHRHGRESGKSGELVTVLDALKAVNEYLSNVDSMPGNIFTFDDNGSLYKVSEYTVGILDKASGALVGMYVNDDDTTLRFHGLDKSFLMQPLKNFSAICFDVFKLDNILSAYKKTPEKYKEVYQRLMNTLGKESNEIILARVLVDSLDKEERKKGFDLLLGLYENKGCIKALSKLVCVYFRDPKKYPFVDKLPTFVRQLIKSNEKWVVVTKAHIPFIHETIVNAGDVPVLMAFLEEPLFEYDTNGVSVLKYIARKGDVAMMKKVLSVKKYDLGERRQKFSELLLEDAAAYNNVAMCRFLVERGLGPNYDDGRYLTAIDRAAKADAIDALKYLLDEAQGREGDVLAYAIKYSALKAVRYLVEKNSQSASAVYYGVRENNVYLNKLYYGKSPLSWGAMSGNVEMCKYLVGQGASLDWKDDDESAQSSPLMIAVQEKKYSVLDYFISLGKEIQWKQYRILFSDREGVDWVVQRINKGKIKRGLPLTVAIADDRIEVVKRLSNHINLDCFMDDLPKPHRNDWIPLQWAASCNSLKSVKYFVSRGADVDIFRAETGPGSPLEEAANKGYLDVVKFLYGEKNAMLRNAIYYAIRESQKGVVDYFLSFRNIDGTLRFPINGKEYSFLMDAVRCNNIEMFNYLHLKGADWDHALVGECTPLEFIVRRDNVDMFRMLRNRYNVQVDALPLVAAEYGSLKCMEYFIDTCGVSPDATWKDSKYGCGFLLQEAAGEGKLEMCKYLIKKGANVNHKPVYERVILLNVYHPAAREMAVKNNHWDVVRYLDSVGAKRD